MILFFAFAVILGIMFAVITVLTGSSKTQKVIDKRILAILLSGSQGGAMDEHVQQLLKPDPINRFAWLNVVLQKYHVSRILKTINSVAKP